MSGSIYIVWCPTSDAPPVKRHATVEEARAESRRLAEQFQQREFFVCRVIESVQFRTDPFVMTNFCKSGR